MASVCSFRSYSLYNLQSSIRGGKLRVPSNFVVFRPGLALRPDKLICVRVEIARAFVCKAAGDSSNPDEVQETQYDVVATQSNTASDSMTSISRFQSMIRSSPPVVFVMKRCSRNSIWIGVCIFAAVFLAAVRAYAIRRSRHNSTTGSVADLVRRGQLRSDRRGISKPLRYDDPFNNPFVKIGKSSSTVEMCGKVYKLAPVTLTEEQQSIHQRRRSRAYQWKRPTVFLKEGESIPPDVDPDTVRWIPANHPFATTVSDIDQELAQNNVYLKHGVPFRIQAEHEALQRKFEALQSDEKLNNLIIDGRNAKDFERPYKSSSPKPDESNQKTSGENHVGNSSTEEAQKS
ncbi:PREDICTED: protein MULTIPLE CHLOROPLAST DIVISION SITE 1 isoform X2 [Tarenaya hassleriana]|uniref:protein MULTIPLE CHLOROPLAST DIVISION SITE 1 isoform X2 n=1 Tax=Tarenaya hassleriana TaxID=28532 RepID=UPI00053C9DF4|nr:PREDICTED: protein MULTIPLE CHLOROPLAST DIVISION SITE 1 isoform X2 [Tarenaya hassleriana]